MLAVATAAASHLANKATGVVLFLLVVSALCFFAGAVIAFAAKAWWAIAVSVGLAVFMLAFLVT
jgi:ABC-type uncharacterized transport system permease subunit